jgi:hypothetical protein
MMTTFGDAIESWVKREGLGIGYAVISLGIVWGIGRTRKQAKQQATEVFWDLSGETVTENEILEVDEWINPERQELFCVRATTELLAAVTLGGTVFYDWSLDHSGQSVPPITIGEDVDLFSPFTVPDKDCPGIKARWWLRVVK